MALFGFMSLSKIAVRFIELSLVLSFRNPYLIISLSTNFLSVVSVFGSSSFQFSVTV